MNQIDTTELTPWTAPGLLELSTFEIIRLITMIFELPDHKWVTAKCRKREYVVPRQILHACLVKYLKITTAKAGQLTGQEHATVIHGIKNVNQTLCNVKELKPKIGQIFLYCETMSIIREEYQNAVNNSTMTKTVIKL